MRRGARAACLAVGLGWAAAAQAVDGIAVEAGRFRGIDVVRASVALNWARTWPLENGRQVRGFWDLSLAGWRVAARAGQNERLVDFGVTPTLRIQSSSLSGPYLEGGFGLHALSKTSIGERKLGTALQFGTHLGVGYRFGAKRALDLAVHVQHLSNGGLKEPNDGVNFAEVRLQYWF